MLRAFLFFIYTIFFAHKVFANGKLKDSLLSALRKNEVDPCRVEGCVITFLVKAL